MTPTLSRPDRISSWRSRLLVVGLLGIGFAGLEAPSGQAASGFGVEFHSGLPLNLGTKIEIDQKDEERLEFDTRFDTQAWTPPIYWAVRLSRQFGQDELGLELMHHKLVMKDPPSQIQRFAISHGFNIVSAQYGRSFGWVQGRVGVGAVLGHPENTVRGLALSEKDGIRDSGYHLLGPVVMFGVAERAQIAPRASLRYELRWTFASSTSPVARGESEFHLHTFHFLFGLAFHTGD